MDQPEQPTPPADEEKKRADRAAKEVIRDRLDEVRRRIGMGQSDWTIKRELSKEYKCTSRQIGRYLTRTREIIRSEMAPSKIEELKSDSLTFYRAMAADEKVPPNSRLRARENMDKIAGVNVPQKIEIEASVKKVPMGLQESIKEVSNLPIEDQKALANALEVLIKLPSMEPDEDEEEGA